MLVKRIAIIIGALLITPLCPVSIAQTETVSDNKADLCPNDWDYIPNALITLLGAPQSCDVLKYKQSEFGFYSTVELRWSSLKLTIKYQPPESGTYIIETTDISPLTLDWFEAHKNEMIQSSFEIDWRYDQFVGPSAQHYLSKDDGTNAQVWIEHDKDGRISWFRFSYAL